MVGLKMFAASCMNCTLSSQPRGSLNTSFCQTQQLLSDIEETHPCLVALMAFDHKPLLPDPQCCDQDSENYTTGLPCFKMALNSTSSRSSTDTLCESLLQD